ncbi:MAG TPA: DUF4097 family beta strand repeat-containing protein [Acidobacteriaceae bacterium]|nr:DUF4097 family beta strand repeat-containing protein [Acidobacteriaceae bacterium]
MATPPPYSSQDARWQARQAREAARAQRRQMKAQWHAQRQYYRSYWRGFRRPTFVGPVVLLAVGIIALLICTGQMAAPQFWDWYAHWWPLLLIGIGGLLLVEYLLDWNRPWAARRSMSGLVWLVILLICLGWVSRNGRLVGPFAWQFDDGNFFSWMGPEHDNDIQMDFTLPSSKPSVSIDDPHGDVTLAASPDGQMHLRAHEVVHRDSDQAAQRVFGELKPKVDLTGGGAVVTVPQKDGSSVDLTVQLPPAAYASVTAAHGDVTADGLNGGVQVTSNHGDVKLDDIGGDALGHMDHGDFSAHNVQGRVLVDGRGDDVTLSSIRGSVTINGDFFGDIHLEDVGSDVHYHSSQTALDVPHLDGSLTLDGSDLNVTRASGPLHIATRSKDIDLTQIAGDVHIENHDGDVDLVAVEPLGNVQIADRTGNVVVTIPENANFSVKGSTSSDESIRTDFPLKVATAGDRQTLEGSVGQGGVQLQLDTDHGDLELRKGENGTQAAAPPAGAKRFKVPAGTKPKTSEE